MCCTEWVGCFTTRAHSYLEDYALLPRTNIQTGKPLLFPPALITIKRTTGKRPAPTHYLLNLFVLIKSRPLKRPENKTRSGKEAESWALTSLLIVAKRTYKLYRRFVALAICNQLPQLQHKPALKIWRSGGGEAVNVFGAAVKFPGALSGRFSAAFRSTKIKGGD